MSEGVKFIRDNDLISQLASGPTSLRSAPR